MNYSFKEIKCNVIRRDLCNTCIVNRISLIKKSIESESRKSWRWMTHARNAPIKSRKMLGEGAWPLFFKGPVTHSRGSRSQLRCSRAKHAQLAFHTSSASGQLSPATDRRSCEVTLQWRCRARLLSFFRWMLSVCHGGSSPQLSVCAPGQPTPVKSCSYMLSERLWSGIRFPWALWIKTLAGFDTCNLWIND